MQVQTDSDTPLTDILALHQLAFGASEGAAVATLVNALMDDETAEPRLSCVALEGSALLGHILFTATHIRGHDTLNTAILAPLAVDPARQRQGIGRALIAHGLTQLRSQACDAVFVLGDPAYYGRAGFHADHTVAAPYSLAYPHAWQALELRPGALAGVTGTLECARALQSPELW